MESAIAYSTFEGYVVDSVLTIVAEWAFVIWKIPSFENVPLFRHLV